jgi:GNAT superfamily N-acetyltransferase
VDIQKPENIEQQDKSMAMQSEQAEAKLRSFDRARAEKVAPNDSKFVDQANRPITVRTWESGSQAIVRAYDTSKVQVPDRVDTGQAGYANASIEHPYNADTRVRLNDIVTYPEYRGAGTGSEMLKQVEQYAQTHNATEIYGSIDSQNAQDFWRAQSEKGWTIDYSKGAYGEVHKKL